jgi:hypothetical protein
MGKSRYCDYDPASELTSISLTPQNRATSPNDTRAGPMDKFRVRNLRFRRATPRASSSLPHILLQSFSSMFSLVTTIHTCFSFCVDSPNRGRRRSRRSRQKNQLEREARTERLPETRMISRVKGSRHVAFPHWSPVSHFRCTSWDCGVRRVLVHRACPPRPDKTTGNFAAGG